MIDHPNDARHEAPEQGQPTRSDVVTAMAQATTDAVETLDHAETYGRLRTAVYAQAETPWNTRWEQVLTDTASLKLPTNIEEATEVQCRLMLMRGYAALICDVDQAIRDAVIADLEHLATSKVPYISSAAHHIAGKMLVLSAGTPDLSKFDPIAIDQSIRTRMRGIDHYRQVGDVRVVGDSIQLQGLADLPAGAIDPQYANTIPQGAESPVTHIVIPQRLVGTGYEAIGALQMAIGQDTEAVQSLRIALAAAKEWDALHDQSEKPYPKLNRDLFVFATRGLIAHLQHADVWGEMMDGDVQHTWEEMQATATTLFERINALQEVPKAMSHSKMAEWNACVHAALAMTNHRLTTTEQMIDALESFVTVRGVENNRDSSTAKKVIRHDAIYSLAAMRSGDHEQQRALGSLLK